MQDFGTKADNSPPPGGQLSAAEFNNLATENENAILRSGLALSSASATQLAQSIFMQSVKAQTFQDSGAANAYVATPVSGSSGVLLPQDYVNLDGALIIFKASATNSAASTLNLGQTTGALLGTKAIVDQAGAALTSSAIVAGTYIQLRYDASIGAGSWVLLPWIYSAHTPDFLNVRANIAAASATATISADSLNVNTALAGKSYQLPLFSKTINLAVTGAGGMDAGSAPASGWVAVYAIYNPVTGASALLATNATSSVMPEVYGAAPYPSGYAASALVAILRTNASSQFAVQILVDRAVFFFSSIYNGAGSTSFVAVSLASAVPPNAKTVQINVSLTASAAGVPSIAFCCTPLGAGTPGYSSFASYNPGSQVTGTSLRDIPVITLQTVYLATSGVASVYTANSYGYTF